MAVYNINAHSISRRLGRKPWPTHHPATGLLSIATRRFSETRQLSATMQAVVPTPRERRPIFVWDTETTGLSPAKESMVEIAIMELEVTSPKEKGSLLSFSSLMRPKKTSKEGPRAASRIHGITNSMLQDAPHFRAAWKGVEEYVRHASQGRGRPILVAHNLPFDLRFLKEELRRLDLGLPPWDFADSVRDVAHVVWPGEKASLQALVDRLGIVNEEAHRALCDVEATGKVLEKADELIAAKAISEDDSIRNHVRRGDFIYNVILKAAESHRPEISPFWREDFDMESSIPDSETVMSSPERLNFGAMSLSSSLSETATDKSTDAVIIQTPSGSVHHTQPPQKSMKTDERPGRFVEIVRNPFQGAVYFTQSGECFHTNPNCYGLRCAHTPIKADKPLSRQRPCQLCCK